MELKIDTTLNIETAIAALGILGAAIGFIVNLFKGWSKDAAEVRYQGTNHVILDLLESSFRTGLSDEQLWSLYNSGATAEKRKKFKAWKPSKLRQLGFENQLKHLQSRFLIRLTGPGHYHIDFREPREWEYFDKRANYLRIIDEVKSAIGQTALNAVIKQAVAARTYSSYYQKHVYVYLLQNGDAQAVHTLIANLQDPDPQIREAAVETFATIYSEIV